LPSCLTFLVLFILKPFEFDSYLTKRLIFWSLIFAATVGTTIFCSVAVVKKIFRKTIEENWTLKHEVLLILGVVAIISLEVYVLFLLLSPGIGKRELFNLVVFRTLAISFFPVLILVLYEQNHHQKLQRQRAERFNQELLKNQNSEAQNPHKSTYSGKVVLVAENEKVALQVDTMNLVFAKAEGNYVEVFYHHAEKVQKELIRNSLKAIEGYLPAADFFRCHKSFVVNLHHIQKVEGNARNLELILEDIEEHIPVSRAKSERLLQLFQQKA